MDTSPSAPNAAPAAIVADLKGTRPWVLVVTVAGYLLTGLCLLVALVALLFPAMIPRDKETPGGPGVFSLIYLFVAAIYLTFTILLHGYPGRFASCRPTATWAAWNAPSPLSDAIGGQSGSWC